MAVTEETIRLINNFLEERINESVIGVFSVTYDKEFTEDVVVDRANANRISKENIAIAVYGDGETDRGFINDPYFKIYNGRSFDSTPKNRKTRISIYRPEYIIHQKEEWVLDSGMRKALIKILNYQLTEDKTVWTEILNQCVKLSKGNMTKELKEKIQSAKMPDYTQLRKLKN